MSNPMEQEFEFLKVHHRDPKTGAFSRVTPYTYVCEGGNQHFIRDGVKYHTNGKPMEEPKVLAQALPAAQEKAQEAAPEPMKKAVVIGGK